jgi:hypothetical protein
MMTPANQPATIPITIQAIMPPGLRAAARTSVAKDIVISFLASS